MLKSIPEIREKLFLMNESELRKILCLLFEHLGLKEVVEAHGSQEYGKDIVFYDEDKLGNRVWFACVVKIHDINQSGFETVTRQVNECFRKKYPSISSGHVKIDKVYVITSGSFKDNAKTQIAEQIDEKIKEIIWWTDSDIAKRIEKHEQLVNILFGTQNLIQNVYNEYINGILLADNGMRILESDFDVKIQSLENFHIKVKAKARQFEEERGEYLKAIDAPYKNIPLKYLPDINGILVNKKYILIHGIATSGKSTILKKLGKDFLNKGMDGFVFYYELNKIYASLEDVDFIKFIKDDFFKITNAELDFLALSEKKISILILLDALDEISNEEEREAILEKITDLKAFSHIKVVLTSRTNEFLDNNDKIKEMFDSYELLPLTTNDIVNLGSKVIGESTQLDGFIRLVRHSELIKSFPKTPLTAILLAILFKEERLETKELPKNITELYAKFVDVFLNRWDKGKGLSEQYLYKEKEFVLQKIAEYLHRNGLVSIQEVDLHEFLENLFISRSMSNFGTAKDFLTGIQNRTSLLIKDEYDNTYKFFHLTIQEYLSISLFDHNEEELLVENFFDDWWLNPNIFYAGKKSHSFAVLDRISKFDVLPADIDSKFAYVIHSSKVLQAAHLLDNHDRKKVLHSMIVIFDSLVKDIINDFVTVDDTKQKKRSMLELILLLRSIFLEFFSSTQFKSGLNDIGELILKETLNVTDITSYSIFYCLSLMNKDSDYLYKFLIETTNINPRWYRIVDVDIKIKRLAVTNRKRQLKIQGKAVRNRHYIYQQFSERLEKHYNSITGLSE